MTCLNCPKHTLGNISHAACLSFTLCHILHRPQISIHCDYPLHGLVMRLDWVFSCRHLSEYKMKALSRCPRSFLCKPEAHPRTASTLLGNSETFLAKKPEGTSPLAKHAALFLIAQQFSSQRRQKRLYLLGKYVAPFLTTQQSFSQKSQKRLHLSGSTQHPEQSPPTRIYTSNPHNCSTIQHPRNRRNV